jgi:lipopolysaccharide export system protein LptA
LVTPQEPISIDADHLSILESKHQAVFKGNVHAIQDGVHMRCSQLTVSYASTSDMPAAPSKKIQEELNSASETSLVEGVTVTSLECDGPVTMTSDDQIVTGKHASFDKGAQVIKVSGDAKLVQGSNILTGDRILYSLSDRVARVEGHVKALFTPKESGASKNSSGQ